MSEKPPAAFEASFTELLDESVKQALFFQQPQPFLDWLQAELSARAAEFIEVPEPATVRALALHLGLALWNHLPLPRNRFRPEPLPKPERNSRCPCGSGLKYKQCCGRLPQTLPLDTDAVWQLALPHLPRSELHAAIAAHQIPVLIVGQLADEALQRDKGRDAVRLLEPLFQGALSALDHRHAVVLNLLCDAFDATERTPRRKRLLLERLSTAPDKVLRSNAWQRLASFHMGQGHDDQAWDCFQQAQRADPSDPDLAMLELLLLCSRGHHDQARGRARFWLQQYQRLGIDDPERLEFLRLAQTDPEAAFAQLGRGQRDPALLQLEALLVGRGLPTSSSYQAVPLRATTDDGRGADDPMASIRESLRGMGVDDTEIERHLPAMQAQMQSLRPDPARSRPHAAAEPDLEHGLQASAELGALEARWHAAYPGRKPFSTASQPPRDDGVWDAVQAERWLAFLHAHPQALDSFDVLDDLLIALEFHPEHGLPGFADTLIDPLLEHAVALLRQAVGHDADLRLPWGVSANRPALRLLSRHIHSLVTERDDYDAGMTLVPWMLQLNPDDNHGYRGNWANHLLARGDDAAMLELWQRYPDDTSTPQISYGYALALFRLGHHAQADAALSQAREALPEVARALTATRFKLPRPDPLGMVVGGKEQAGYYRQEMLETWQASPGAMDWLRAATPGRVRRPR